MLKPRYPATRPTRGLVYCLLQNILSPNRYGIARRMNYRSPCRWRLYVINIVSVSFLPLAYICTWGVYGLALSFRFDWCRHAAADCLPASHRFVKLPQYLPCCIASAADSASAAAAACSSELPTRQGIPHNLPACLTGWLGQLPAWLQMAAPACVWGRPWSLDRRGGVNAAY